MKKAVAKKSCDQTKNQLYFRYEFSDEAGRPEGGDIFRFASMANLKKMMTEVIAVAESDGVCVSFTIGKGEQFFKLLNNLGLSQKEVENEMVDSTLIPFLGDEKAPKSQKTAKSTKTAKAAKTTKTKPAKKKARA